MNQAPVTLTEYLRQERQAEFRSELINGEIYAMMGASRAHVVVNLNVAVALSNKLSFGAESRRETRWRGVASPWGRVVRRIGWRGGMWSMFTALLAAGDAPGGATPASV